MLRDERGRRRLPRTGVKIDLQAVGKAGALLAGGAQEQDRERGPHREDQGRGIRERVHQFAPG
eukprot:13658580-Alexandrium_andersonii.AAC.1